MESEGPASAQTVSNLFSPGPILGCIPFLTSLGNDGGGSLYQAAICQVQTHPSVLGMWGDEGVQLED